MRARPYTDVATRTAWSCLMFANSWDMSQYWNVFTASDNKSILSFRSLAKSLHLTYIYLFDSLYSASTSTRVEPPHSGHSELLLTNI